MLPIEENDLRVFADIGAAFEGPIAEAGRRVFNFFMDGKKAVVIAGAADEPIKLILPERSVQFPNAKALLANELFGDLRRWAGNQVAALTPHMPPNPIEVSGAYRRDAFSESSLTADFARFDTEIGGERDCPLHVIVVDGPAGIGKTTQIQRLAYERAKRFGRNHDRLVLHIESRGRVLQNFSDLIAGSLDTIRSKLANDQLSVLVRHGLVLLAIDGFDELADPNGYHLAWSQLNSLLGDVVGEGQVLLAGRETFVSPGRMSNALQVLGTPGVRVSHFTMREVDPKVARKWLRDCGWAESSLRDDLFDELLTPGSYALRPFFLFTLAKSKIEDLLAKESSVDLLSILVNALIVREGVQKFGEDITNAVSPEALAIYVRNLSEEIARDMADNQGEALPGQTVTWIAQLCLPSGLDPSIGKTLIHRAISLPFLTADTAHNVVRFAHRQFFVFFLGSNAVRTVAIREFPKYLRRNILGSEFLECFSKVLRDLPIGLVEEFRDRALEELPSLNTFDQSAGNVTALFLTCSCEFPPSRMVTVGNCSIDEVYLFDEVPAICLQNATISSLFATDADLRNLSFEGDCQIFALHATADTRLSENSPLPMLIETEDSTLSSPADKKEWLGRTPNRHSQAAMQIPFDTDLLDRILRYRSFWLREMDNVSDPIARRIIFHSDWSKARAWLSENHLARFDDRTPASGEASCFIHFRMDKIRLAISGDLNN